MTHWPQQESYIFGWRWGVRGMERVCGRVYGGGGGDGGHLCGVPSLGRSDEHCLSDTAHATQFFRSNQNTVYHLAKHGRVGDQLYT